MDKKELIKKIENFVKTKKKCVGTGYPEVLDSEISELNEIVGALIDLKYEEDCDGHRPVSYKIVDKTYFQSCHYTLVPHAHKDRADFYENYTRAVFTNLNIAQTAVKNMEHHLKEVIDFAKESNASLKKGIKHG